MHAIHAVRLTDHAAARMQQRGIRAAALAALLEHGRVARAPGGCDLLFFDKRTRARLPQQSRTYAILASDGTVITVGHRYRRVRI